MANMFMSIEGIDFPGATITVTGEKPGRGAAPSWCSIDSFYWEAARSVSMDIGNGMNRDSGMTLMSEVSITRELDGASEYLLSRMYVPGNEGDVITFIATKPDRDGKGGHIYLQVQLVKARIVYYNFSVVDSSIPSECLSISYDKFRYVNWHENVGGELEKGVLLNMTWLPAQLTL